MGLGGWGLLLRRFRRHFARSLFFSFFLGFSHQQQHFQIYIRNTFFFVCHCLTHSQTHALVPRPITPRWFLTFLRPNLLVGLRVVSHEVRLFPIVSGHDWFSLTPPVSFHLSNATSCPGTHANVVHSPLHRVAICAVVVCKYARRRNQLRHLFTFAAVQSVSAQVAPKESAQWSPL